MLVFEDKINISATYIYNEFAFFKHNPLPFPI
jgi:hypothetical protein